MSQPMYHPELPGYLESLVPQRNEVMLEMEAYAKEVRFLIIGVAAETTALSGSLLSASYEAKRTMPALN